MTSWNSNAQSRCGERVLRIGMLIVPGVCLRLVDGFPEIRRSLVANGRRRLVSMPRNGLNLPVLCVRCQRENIVEKGGGELL